MSELTKESGEVGTRSKAGSASGMETNLTQEFRKYMIGAWKFKVAVRPTKIVSAFEMEFSANGEFLGTRSVNNFLQETFSGTWLVLPSSSESFTLTLNCAAEDPKSITLRLVDHDSVEDLNNGSRWLRA